MKRNTGKYREVDELPQNATTVAEYARSKDISQSYIYKLVARQKADFEIVIFKTMNFIVPYIQNDTR